MVDKLPIQHILDYQRDMDENRQQIRKMVMVGYRDIEADKGRGCNKFFEKLEKRYTNNRI